jgi:ABC-type spermidine/putrescine transport system permease subunit I
VNVDEATPVKFEMYPITIGLLVAFAAPAGEAVTINERDIAAAIKRAARPPLNRLYTRTIPFVVLTVVLTISIWVMLAILSHKRNNSWRRVMFRMFGGERQSSLGVQGRAMRRKETA